MAVYLNLDEVQPEKRILTVGKRDFDVTDMPVSVMFFINKTTVTRQKEGSGVLYSDYYEALYMWFKSQDETITQTWMDEHITGTMVKQIIGAVFVPLLNPSPVAFVEKEATTKNTPRKE